MRTWNCIDSIMWEEWGGIKICRECGYLEALKTLDGHDPSCTIGNAAKMFASCLSANQDNIEKKRIIRLEKWGIQVSEDSQDGDTGKYNNSDFSGE